jgi:hypothetical protein
VLWGDSAATALHPGIQAVMGDRYNIAELTASACPPFGADYIPLSERPLCGEVNAFVLSYIAKTQLDVVLLSAAPNYPGVDIAKYTRSTIIALKLIGIRRVIVVGPPPMWPEAMPKLILKAYLKNERADFPDKLDLPSTVESASEAVDQSLKDVSEQAGASYVSAYHTLCDGRLLPAMLKRADCLGYVSPYGAHIDKSRAGDRTGDSCRSRLTSQSLPALKFRRI